MTGGDRTHAGVEDVCGNDEEMRKGSGSDDSVDSDQKHQFDSLPLTRRAALATLGLGGLLGYAGLGTASADASGTIGTKDRPLVRLYTEGIAGGLTGGTELTDLQGTGMEISDTALALADSGVGSTQLADSAVTNAKVANEAIATDELADSAVTDAKLIDGAVTDTKLANGAVTDAKLANGAVTDTKLADGVGSNWEKAGGLLEPADSDVGGIRVDKEVRIATAGNGNGGNIVGGHPYNAVTGDSVGAVIAGGGQDFNPNEVSNDYATIGGGRDNIASGTRSTIAGGARHEASGWEATIGGGSGHEVRGRNSTVCGGIANNTTASHAAVCGGQGNTASEVGSFVGSGFQNEASGRYSSIPGGEYNTAAGEFSFAAGREATAEHDGAFVFGDSSSSSITSQGTDEVRFQMPIYAPNLDDSGDDGSDDGDDGSDIDRRHAGRYLDGNDDEINFIGPAEWENSGDTGANSVSGTAATVGGGAGNVANNNYATVSGGEENEARNPNATVGGGQRNKATAHFATVAGGVVNDTTGQSATVGGGQNNEASSSGATVPGGMDNVAAGSYSFAAGRGAKANHNGSYVFADGDTGDYSSNFQNTAYFQVHISADGGISESSSRTVKTAIEPVDSVEVLDKVDSLDVSTWEFTSDVKSEGRHMGPIAEDFYEIFELGDDERAISTIDRDGVALAAIKGLSQKLDEKGEHLDALDDENARLRTENEALRDRVAAIEAHLGLDDSTTTENADD